MLVGIAIIVVVVVVVFFNSDCDLSRVLYS